MTEHPEKRLCQHPPAVLCDHGHPVLGVLARWPPTPAQPPVEQPGRERVVLAEHRVPVVRAPYRHLKPLTITDDERYGDNLLGAAGACVCVAISVLLLVVLAVRALWLWL